MAVFETLENINHFIFTSGRLGNFSLDNLSKDYNTFYRNINVQDAFLVCLSICFHIQLRYVVVNYVCKPISVYLKADPKYERKAGDSGYKFVFQLMSFLFGIKILFSKDCVTCFHYNKQEIADASPDASIPLEVQIYYFNKMGYYLFGLYSEKYLAPPKKSKDRAMMTIHHICTILLLSGSYITRSHACGVIIAFTHQSSDLFYHLGKLFLSWKYQDGKLNSYFNIGVIVSAVMVPFTWIITRLYYFPIIAIRMALNYPPYCVINVFVIFLLVILIMDWIWIVALFRFYCNIISGKQEGLSDPLDPENKKVD